MKYTTAELNAMPDLARLQDKDGYVWRPYFWKGERNGWADGEFGKGNWPGEWLPSHKLARCQLTPVEEVE